MAELEQALAQRSAVLSCCASTNAFSAAVDLAERGNDDLFVAGLLGRCEQEQVLRLAREPPGAVQKGNLDPVADRQGVGQRLAAAQLTAGERASQLQQSQRVAPGVLDERGAHRGGHRCPAASERSSTPASSDSPATTTSGTPVSSNRSVPGSSRTEKRKATGSARQPTYGEHQGVGGRAVAPLDVVEQAEQRLFPPCLAEQAEETQRHEEAVRRAAGRHPERDLDRMRLRRGQRTGQRQQGAQQLMGRRIGELRLRLHAGAAQQRASARLAA